MSMKINEERRTKLVEVLADVLNRLCERNDRFMKNNTPVTRFHALRPPQITIKFYLQRIAKYSSCSEECFILALIYIDRLIRRNGKFLVNSLNVHRLVITSVMLGAKFFDDQYFNNKYFGKVGGVSGREMNLLEIEFLFMINFDLFVEIGLYKMYNKRLMTHSETLRLESAEQSGEDTRIEVKEVDSISAAFSKEPIAIEVKQRVSECSNHVSSIQPTLGSPSSAAASVMPQKMKRSTSGSSVPKVRHYSTQRCTPPSPKFLTTNNQIHMEMH